MAPRLFYRCVLLESNGSHSNASRTCYLLQGMEIEWQKQRGSEKEKKPWQEAWRKRLQRRGNLPIPFERIWIYCTRLERCTESSAMGEAWHAQLQRRRSVEKSSCLSRSALRRLFLSCTLSKMLISSKYYFCKPDIGVTGKSNRSLVTFLARVQLERGATALSVEHSSRPRDQSIRSCN